MLRIDRKLFEYHNEKDEPKSSIGRLDAPEVIGSRFCPSQQPK